MKMIKKIIVAVFMSLAMMVSVVHADNYAYTIHLYSGGSGSSEDSVLLQTYTKNYGETLSFSQDELQAMVNLPEDSKYYVKGVKKAGHDNNDTDDLNSLNYYVSEDMDLVIKYGLKETEVNYTVNFVDTEGNPLSYVDQNGVSHDSLTYYGNVGDKVVVACVYIDGYEPNAYNLKKTLVKDESENVLTFTYTKNPGFVYRYVDLGAINGGTTYLGTTTNGTNNANNANNPGNGTNQGGTTDGTDNGEGPQDVVDLDDNETPLANLDDNETPKGFFSSENAPIIAGIGAGILAIIAIILFFLKKKKSHA